MNHTKQQLSLRRKKKKNSLLRVVKLVLVHDNPRRRRMLQGKMWRIQASQGKFVLICLLHFLHKTRVSRQGTGSLVQASKSNWQTHESASRQNVVLVQVSMTPRGRILDSATHKKYDWVQPKGPKSAWSSRKKRKHNWRGQFVFVLEEEEILSKLPFFLCRESRVWAETFSSVCFQRDYSLVWLDVHYGIHNHSLFMNSTVRLFVYSEMRFPKRKISFKKHWKTKRTKR